MAERIFNIEKFQSYWDSLSVEQRSPGRNEIQLMLAEDGSQMSIAYKDGNAVVLPWLFGPDEDGARLLFQMLEQGGIQTGMLEDYLMEEAVPLQDTAPSQDTAACETAACETDCNEAHCDEDEIEEDEDLEDEVESEDDTGLVIGAVATAIALVGGGYLAYRMFRRPNLDSIRFG